MNLKISVERLERRLTPSSYVSLVSRADPLAPPDTPGGASDNSQLSADGRYVAYTSTAANVVAGQLDVNGATDVFLYDRVSDTTTLVSHASGSSLTAADGASSVPVISADGRYVIYQSTSENLVAGFVDNNGTTSTNTANTDIYLFDRLLGTNELVSHAASNLTAGQDGQISPPSNYRISAHGDVVVYTNTSTNLVAGYIGKGQQAYMFNPATCITTLLSHKAGLPTTGASAGGSVGGASDDGQRVLYSDGDAKVLDRPTGNIILVSHKFDSLTTGAGGSGVVAISSDGSKVLFSSSATTLVANFVNNNGTFQDYYYSDLSTGVVTLVTHAASSPTAGANGNDLISGTMSADGSTIAYRSVATNLVGGFTAGNANATLVYAYSVATGINVLVSRSTGTTSKGANDNNLLSGISGSGQTITYQSRATDLIAGFVRNDGSNSYDTYTFDIPTGTQTLISHSAASTVASGDGESYLGQISRDGSTITFTSYADDLQTVLRDTNGQPDIYAIATATGAVSIASRRAGTTSATADGGSDLYQQSGDGRFVVFASSANNLVPGQVDVGSAPTLYGETQDIFLHDRVANTTILVSHACGTPATAANGESGVPVISRDGRYVAYCSWATNLISGFVDGNGPPAPNDYYGHADVFLYDRITGTTQLVSRQAGTTNGGGNGNSGTFLGYYKYTLSISNDGRYVAYISLATDLVPGFIDNNGSVPANDTGADIFVFDRITGMNRLVSHAAGATTSGGDDSSYEPSISGDGQYVAYWSQAGDLVPGMSYDGSRQIFLFDQESGDNTLVSHVPWASEIGGNGLSTIAACSNNGEYVIYESSASNLVTGSADNNQSDDIFLYCRQTDVNTLVSHAAGSLATAGNQGSDTYASVSDDGRFVVYQSGATDLVSGFVDNNGPDVNFDTDVFLFDRQTGINTLVSHAVSFGAAGSNQNSTTPSISGDGRFVGFASPATNLVADYSAPNGNLVSQTYVYDQMLGQTALVSRALNGGIGDNEAGAYFASMSTDGSVLVFASHSDNLLPNDFNDFADIFAYVTTPPMVQSVVVADGSAQRSVVRSLTVNFDEPVLFAGDPAAAFELSQNGSVVSGPWSVVNVANNPNTSVTITFTGPISEFGSLIDVRYQLKMLASQISNIQPLDGNGDGVPGDDYVFNFHRLFGDLDGNGTVNAADFLALRSAFGSTSFAFDFNNTGTVDAADFLAFRSRFGASV